MNRNVAAITAGMLDQIPEDQLRGGDPIADGLDTLTDAELVTVANAVAVTAKQAPADSPTATKATKVLKAAAKVARAREDARVVLAKKLPYPAAFAASKAGQVQTAVAARRVRLGTPLAEFGSGNGPVRRPMGPLKYWRTWVNQGRWGRGQDPLRGLGGLGSLASQPSIERDGVGSPRDAIEAAIMGGRGSMEAYGLGGLGSLAGLNFGKFFKNLAGAVGGIASIAAPIAMAVPGVGTAVGAGIAAAGNLANAFSQGQQQQAPQVYGPPMLPPPPPAPVQAESKTPAWLIPAAIGAGVLLLTRK